MKVCEVNRSIEVGPGAGGYLPLLSSLSATALRADQACTVENAPCTVALHGCESGTQLVYDL